LNKPKDYKAIMVSSTFTDLKEHRQQAIEAIQKLGYMPRVMEYSGAQAEADVIDTSLAMVREAAAYVGVISLKYGQTPYDRDRNPKRLSVTELEFNEAMRLGRPVVLFIMGDDHPVRKADIESDPKKMGKLNKFRERAKRMREGSEVQRIYEVFDSLDQFSKAAAPAIGNLIRYLERMVLPENVGADRKPRHTISNVPINIPFHFVGRKDDLAAIDEALISSKGRPAIAVLHGLRGVGKTTLAAAYAEWCSRDRDYRATWWIRAETEPTLRTDLCGIGLQMGWSKPADPEEQAVEQVLNQLSEEGEHVLLIYDNARSMDELTQYLPKRSETRILITSNARDWGKIAKRLQIEVWPTEVGAEYLMARTERRKEPLAAFALATELGGLPLAHEQAAAFCERTSCSLARYLEEFKKTPVVFSEKDAPEEYHNRRTVAKTFAMAIDEAAKVHPAAAVLISYAALLAPEPIPLSLFFNAFQEFSLAPKAGDGGLDDAVGALVAFALVDRDSVPDERDPSIETDCIRLHRLVRLVAGLRWSEDHTGLPVRRDVALNEIVAAFARIYPKDIRGSSDVVWRLFPHIVEVLRTLVSESEVSEAREMLDELTRLVVMALRVAEDKERAGSLIPEYLATVLGDFYEVEPLKKPIQMLIENHGDAWPGLQEQFLSTDNYVLRYAMAEALADIHRKDPSLVTIARLTALVNARTVNEFELGGYALALVYARNPEKIDPRVLTALAERPEYSGRSILGDLFLNLVFKKDFVLDMEALVSSDRFWKPKWDFIWVDVDAIEAARYFMASPRLEPPADSRQEVKEEFRNLVAVEADIATFLRSAPRSPQIVAVLDGYFVLGQELELVSEAEDALAVLPLPDLCEFIRVLFAHPIWAVAEVSASILSRLIEKDANLLGIVARLMDDANWRVRYGACEAAFILSSRRRDLFVDSVHRLFNDRNCKIRGLCAENLSSFILNSSFGKRIDLVAKFTREYHFWTADEDCWVLEHIFRFFHTLNKRHVDVDPLIPQKLSRLLDGEPKWYAWERGQFLCHIEASKDRIRSKQGPSEMS